MNRSTGLGLLPGGTAGFRGAMLAGSLAAVAVRSHLAPCSIQARRMATASGVSRGPEGGIGSPTGVRSSRHEPDEADQQQERCDELFHGGLRGDSLHLAREDCPLPEPA